MSPTKEIIEHRLDADQPDEKLVEELAGVIGKAQQRLKAKPAVTLRFVIHNSGRNERPVEHEMTRESLQQTEQDAVFPAVVREILEKEFPRKVAHNQQLVEHITNQLKNDVYWSQEVVKLIKTIRRHQGLT